MKLHYKQKLQFFNAVSKYLVEQGYHVSRADLNWDSIQVWGKYESKKCYEELTFSIYRHGDFIIGYCIDTEDNDDTYLELNIQKDSIYYNDLDSRFFCPSQLDTLTPFKKGKLL